MKTALNQEAAWEVQDKREGQPHGWVQWKGTDVCMDIYCECGCHSHIDAEFAYSVKCPSCGAVYSCNGHIEFVKIAEEPDSCCILGNA